MMPYCSLFLPKRTNEALALEYEGNNFFSLVRSQDQKSLENATKPPVEPFITGFPSASMEELSRYLRDLREQRMRQRSEGKTEGYFNICCNSLIILEERTMKDHTANLGVYRGEIEMDDEGNELGWESWHEEWRSVRVHFAELAECALCAGVKGHLFVGRESKEQVDERGIYHRPKPEGDLEEVGTPRFELT